MLVSSDVVSLLLSKVSLIIAVFVSSLQFVIIFVIEIVALEGVDIGTLVIGVLFLLLSFVRGVMLLNDKNGTVGSDRKILVELLPNPVKLFILPEKVSIIEVLHSFPFLRYNLLILSEN